MDNVSPPEPKSSSYPTYVGSVGTWVGGISLENLLVQWVLLGVLAQSAAHFGESRALIATPPLLLLLIGGIWADRTNSRTLLLRITVISLIPPLFLAAISDSITVWWLIAMATALAALQALGDPARQAILNRVTRMDIQRSVVIVTIVPSLIGIAAYGLAGGFLETIGLRWSFIAIAVVFALSALCVQRLPEMPVVRQERLNLLNGFRALLRIPLMRNVVGMNFASTMFNAGAGIVGVPLIVTSVYNGDASMLAWTMMLFTAGSTTSNVLLLFVMPMKRPGRLLVNLQLTRVVLLVILLFAPPKALFLFVMFLWGLNMGVTSTLVRTTIQESAPEYCRAQILSFLLFSFMLASPLSSLLLGWLAESTSALMSLAPGVAISIGLFIFGRTFSGLWEYESPTDSNRSRFEVARH